MNPLKEFGRSANLTYYAEQSTHDNHIWAEVCRNNFTWASGEMVKRTVPTFSVTVYVNLKGEVGRFVYRPKVAPVEGPLSSRTITRLVRAYIEGKETWDSQPRRPAVPARTVISRSGRG